MVKVSKGDYRILLHNIRSEHNVGSIFRTADSAGVSKIYISGYSPAPVDKYGRGVRAIKKTALGADSTVSWERINNPQKIIKELRKEKFQIIGIEQDKKSVDYKKVKIGKRAIFIVGNEVTGISQNLLNECDVIAEIDMKGKKESLNVTVSLGIALFRILNI